MPKELEYVEAALRAGGDRGPDSFAPISARFAASALRDPALDHHKSDRLFRQIVGRLDARRGNEAEVTVAVFQETVGIFESAAAERAGVQRIFPGLVERLGRKVGPLVFGMSLLAARFSFPLLLGRFLGVDDIARRRFGRKLLGLVSWEPLGWPKEWPDVKVEVVWDDGNVRVILRGDLRRVKRDFEDSGIKVQLRLVVATSP